MTVAIQSEASHADKFLTSGQIRARYGDVSDMWLWRRLHDNSGFPQPLVLNRRRYWRLSDLLAWEHACHARAQSANGQGGRA